MHGGAADAALACDIGFGEAGTVQLANPSGMKGSCHWSDETLTALPGTSQAGTQAFAQNFAFELGENICSRRQAWRFEIYDI